jgi:Xaa-Pro aminopeptidase
LPSRGPATTLGPDFYDGLRQALSDQNLLNGTDIVFRQQHIKSAQEIAYMRRAGQLADLAIEAAARVIRVGMTEFEVAAEIERTLRINGSEYTGLPAVCSREERARQGPGDVALRHQLQEIWRAFLVTP